MTEKLLKALPVLVFAVFFSDDRKDVLPAAMSVGIGFSILENTAILVQNLTVVTLGWAALRGLSASLMHGLCTMIIGAGLPYVKKQRKLFCTGIFGLFTVSATMHALFNLLIQSDYSWLRLFSHGIVCAVLCRPAYRPDKAAVPVILRKIFRNLANDLWQLEPEVVFQWGRFYFRGQPLYRGRLSARIHFVISRSGVQVTPPAPIFRFGTQVN